MSYPISTFLVNRFTFADAGSEEYIIDLDRFNPQGFFSLQGKGAAGTPAYAGAIEVTFAVSNNGTDFIEDPNGDGAIMTGISDQDEAFASFSPPPCRWLKLIFTADAAIVADFWITIS